jgi:hypothetical protein
MVFAIRQTTLIRVAPRLGRAMLLPSHDGRLRGGLARTARSGAFGIAQYTFLAPLPPLAAGVLVIAGGMQGGPDDFLGELVENEQVGFKLADFIFDFFLVELALAALALSEGAIGPIGAGGLVTLVAGPDVLADDPAVDAAGAVVISPAVGAGFPGHWRSSRSGATQTRHATGQGRREMADADKAIDCSCVRRKRQIGIFRRAAGFIPAVLILVFVRRNTRRG